MAQFISFNDSVEVNKVTVASFINSMEKGRNSRFEILLKYGIQLDKGDWFLQQAWLNAFKEVYISYGEMNLFLIGKAIIDNAIFPPISNLEEALRAIDVAYHINHRLDGKIMYDEATGALTEGIGHYLLTEFDKHKKQAVMVCNNPYPCKFDEGIITQIVRRFKPAGAHERVIIDPTKETRLKGAESCTYLISW